MNSGRNQYGAFTPEYGIDDAPPMVECQLCGKLMGATAGINTIWWGKRVHSDCHRKLKNVKPRQEEADKNLRVYKKFLAGKINYQLKFRFKLNNIPATRLPIADVKL